MDLRARLTFANLISSVALFTALGGVSYAALTIPKNSVGTKQIKNRAVTRPKLDPHLLSSLAGKTGPRGLAGAQGPKGDIGPQGSSGPQAPAAANGQEGAPGPSDIYATGIADHAVEVTSTELASITVPAGSYLLGAKVLLAQHTSGGTSLVDCKLESSDPGLPVLWDETAAPLLTDTSIRSNLSLAGVDTFTAGQNVKVICTTFDTATSTAGAANVRLWAIKTGTLHATLPLPHD